MLRRLILPATLVVLSTSFPAAAAQETSPPPQAAAEGGSEQDPAAAGGDAADAEPAPFDTPDTVEEAVALTPSGLEKALQGRELAELRSILDEWMTLIERQQEAFGEAAEAEEGSELHRAAAGLGTDRDRLISLAEVVIVAVADAGGQVEGARERIASIRQAEAEDLDRVSTVPADQSQAQDLSLEVLRAELRPLTKEQVQEQLSQWLDLLQKKCIEVRKVEVAALESEDDAEVAKYNERAVALRGERGRLRERVKVVIDSLEEKNGDVEDARAYVQSVVVTPPITGPQAMWSTMRAWLLNPDGGISLGLRIAKALGVLVVFWLLARLVGGIVARAMRSVRKASELLREFVVSSARKVTLFIGLVVAAGQLGANLGPVLALIGAAGLVVGLALQGTLSNFASGLLIMVYRPFDVGDVINAGGASGKVEGMTLVTTLIRTFDNQSIYVPNNKVWGDVITNVTANSTRRVDMTFGISYSDDIDHAREVLLEVAKAHEKVLPEPEPAIQVGALGDSSVDILVRPWARTEDYWTVYWDLTRLVKQRFDEEDITIPFPQRDVHLHGGAGDGGALLPPPAAAAGSPTEPAQEADSRR